MLRECVVATSVLALAALPALAQSAKLKAARDCVIWSRTLDVATRTVAEDAKRATASQDLSDTYNATVAPRYALCVERYNATCAGRWGRITRERAAALGLPPAPVAPPPTPFSTPALIDSIPQCSR